MTNRTIDGVTHPGHLAKLPKWAQDRIRNLERDRHSLREELRAALSEEETRVGYGYDTSPGSVGQPKAWLPDGEHVTFYLPDRNRERDTFVQFSFDRQRGGIRVMGSDGPLAVRPEASNVINVNVENR